MKFQIHNNILLFRSVLIFGKTVCTEKWNRGIDIKISASTYLKNNFI